jgi:hypothetical protein
MAMENLVTALDSMAKVGRARLDFQQMRVSTPSSVMALTVA